VTEVTSRATNYSWRRQSETSVLPLHHSATMTTSQIVLTCMVPPGDSPGHRVTIYLGSSGPTWPAVPMLNPEQHTILI